MACIYLLALGLGAAILGANGFMLLRSSARLPIGQFVAFSSALVGVLAVVLMGKGVAAHQKVGYLKMTPISIPHIECARPLPVHADCLGAGPHSHDHCREHCI